MANTLYVTAAEAFSGKSVISLGLMQLLLQHVRKVAFFHPVINVKDKSQHDRDVELMRKQFSLDIPYEDTYAWTYNEARDLITQGKSNILIEKIIEKFNILQEKYDFVLCQGTDFLGSDEAFQFDLNAEIAANLDMPIALVISGKDKTMEEVEASAKTSIGLFKDRGQEVDCLFINRTTLPADEIARCHEVLCNEKACDNIPVFILPEDPVLSKPSIAEVCEWMQAKVLFGRERMDNLVRDYAIAAMQAEHYLNYVEQGLLVITPGDRADLILATLASRLSGSYPDVAGILLTGGFPVPPTITRLMEGWTGAPVPLLSVEEPTFSTLQTLMKLQGKISPNDYRKINIALALFERHVKSDILKPRIINRRTSRMTPLMFEFKLIEQAKRHRMRIVLPEGNEERVLRAAEVLIQREVADIILLGDAAGISKKITELGLELDRVTIIQPEQFPRFEDYVQTYYELRKSKGISLDDARDRMSDATYFGTMMVHMDDADGMVSGSVNTTAHTIRPAFEIIKTKPGASIVSSVFLMCLKDQVLVFGDCAVNPNPSAEQLADIAISSAHTARIFGIAPRVAMLSYSTGGSGKGADVDVVVEATNLAHKRAPELALDGPVQYDAAISPDVARTKAPNSPVAGKATVFIFPDLNTGNNTYKAVQRAASAVAIGPVLQGLNKPVNDLSRGCTVPDIINTVTITAIQAQAEKGLISYED